MKKIILYALLGSVVLTSCKKYIAVNNNPNTATVTKANFIFANALNSSARVMVGGMHITGGSWTGYYGHSTSFTGGGQEKTYVFTNNDFNFFDGVYDNLNDLQFVINNAANDGFPHLVGPAMIMQVMMMQKLVDYYGNVPYTQALQGTGFVTPAYDDAATIYSSLVAKLTQAVNLINAASFPANEPSDIMFNASKTRWKQFANTLKLRLILRRSNVSGYNAAADIATISSDGFIDATVLLNPGFLKTAGKLNWFYGNYGFNENDAPTGDFRKMGFPIVEFLKTSFDVYRLSRICSAKGDPNNDLFSTNPSDYNGVPLGGSGNPYLSSNVSAMGRMQIKKGDATRALVMMTDAESYFLQAEARQRGWLPGSAQAAYEEGVRRDFRFVSNVGLSYATATQAQADAAANAYLVSGVANADWSASTDKLKAIWVQKWVALCNVDGSEAFAEYRRTNSPANPNGNIPSPYTAQSVATTAAQPLRLFYPLRESNVNGANVPLSGNTYPFNTRIFWDIN
jgi:hypothetical protein